MDYEDLVVVATNNGGECLEKCLASLGNKYPILVVDTGSTDKDCLDLVRAQEHHLLMPFRGFTTGAYLWAHWHFPAKNYLFIQDSMEAIEEDFVAPFRAKMPEKGAVAWLWFGFGFDNTPQLEWAKYIFHENWPDKGLWGPVFYTSAATLDELAERQLLPPIPLNKAQAQGCERLWAAAFHQAGMPIEWVTGEWSSGQMPNGMGPFRKIFLNRH